MEQEMNAMYFVQDVLISVLIMIAVVFLLAMIRAIQTILKIHGLRKTDVVFGTTIGLLFFATGSYGLYYGILGNELDPMVLGIFLLCGSLFISSGIGDHRRLEKLAPASKPMLGRGKRSKPTTPRPDPPAGEAECDAAPSQNKPLAPCECDGPVPRADSNPDDRFPTCGNCGFRIVTADLVADAIHSCPHVDDFIDDPDTDPHASLFFLLFRLPESLKLKLGPWLKVLDLRLYCSWRGKRYRVTGCSRLGEIWLSKDLDYGGPGYGHRVEISELSDWSDQA